ncbi:MAG: 7-cyano-7-deazaguanine synthase QueC [candidate division WS1 bacterium]|jgi:7-cyano-7-deazaguanine synthase|nr:7-cyano-7-deazaguanine synthase QueC [candidate division WS1 bacterium]
MSSVLLLSGGLDSLVAAWAARESHPPALALTFDYGQRAAAREAEAALCIAAEIGVDHRLIKLPWMSRLTPASLSDPASDLAEADDASVWVPARNAVFISIAAAHAEAMGAEAIICGFNAEEAATFPDNSPEFVRRCDAMLELATQNHPRVISPTLDLTKREIVSLGIETGAPLHLTWSCYGPGPEHCWQCPSCRRLQAALEEAGCYEQWREQKHTHGG